MAYNYRDVAEKLPELIGKVLTKAEKNDSDDELLMVADDGVTFRFYHDQDCCESVAINDICGDLADLIGSPILQAEESISEKRPDDVPAPEYAEDSQTWTFYKFATIKGSVTVRWFGSSNGYYSESVDLERTQPES